tara:strand:+ start:505 stop:921 length:417 start_codon:yes stop_codon:yes gene_type:complete
MFFKNNKKNKINKSFVKIASLLIHAAKIDEKFTSNEEEIIKQAILKMGADNSKIQEIINEGKTIEENSNQILDFTREVKSMSEKDKTFIIETLWRIIYSNKEEDIYESNLMRRLAGLLYIDNKTIGDIKEKIKKEISQ